MLNIIITGITDILSADWFVDVLALSASCGVVFLCRLLFTFRG